MTNWITRFSRLDPRPSRFEATPDHWRQLEVDLQHWGGTATSWRRLEHLGTIARTDQ